MSEEISAQTPRTYARGIWFDDYVLGEVFESPGRTITETDIVNFAGLSGDFNSFHTDETAARRTVFRKRVAHGMLIQAVVTGLGVRTGIFEGTIQALSDMVIHWRIPVFPGDTIRLRLRVDRIEDPTKRGGKVFFEAWVLNQRDEVVIDGEWGTVILRDRSKPRPPVPEA